MYISVYMTAGSQDEAERIASLLVEEKLAACVNLFPCQSVYRWKGKVETEAEYILLCKTRQSLFNRLRERVIAVHSYDVPAIAAWDIIDGSDEYLDWIGSETEAE